MEKIEMKSHASKLRPSNGLSIGRLMGMWQSRFLVLKNGRLFYYKDAKQFERGEVSRGEIDLSVATVSVGEGECPYPKMLVKIPSREYHFRFHSNALLLQWCHTLEAYCIVLSKPCKPRITAAVSLVNEATEDDDFPYSKSGSFASRASTARCDNGNSSHELLECPARGSRLHESSNSAGTNCYSCDEETNTHAGMASNSPGQLCGVGILFRPQPDGTMEVRELLKGSAAAAGGVIRLGDVLVGVDEMDFSAETTSAEISRKVLGRPGEEVLLKFLRFAPGSWAYTKIEARVTRSVPAMAKPIVVSNPWDQSIEQQRYLDFVDLHEPGKAEVGVQLVRQVSNSCSKQHQGWEPQHRDGCRQVTPSDIEVGDIVTV